MVREILCEQVSCELSNAAKVDQDNENQLEQSHGISTVQWNNKIYYFKRLFEPTNVMHKLQLFRYDVFAD